MASAWEMGLRATPDIGRMPCFRVAASAIPCSGNHKPLEGCGASDPRLAVRMNGQLINLHVDTGSYMHECLRACEHACIHDTSFLSILSFACSALSGHPESVVLLH